MNNDNVRLLICSLITLVTAATSALSQADDSMFGDADLFGESSDSFISTEVDNSTNLADEMLLNDQTVSWSGDLKWRTSSAWIDHPNIDSSASIESDVAGNLKLDARPDKDYRVLVSLDYSASANATETNIREAFVDFNENGFYIRAGQQTLNWGVGYFFSPADVLSIDTIVANNPDADRTGTLAVKIHRPIGTSNYYGYIIPSTTDNSIVAALKSEWLLGGNEISLSGVFHADESLNVIGTVSLPTNQGDFFAEYSATFGESSVGLNADLSPYNRDDELLHQATVGYRGTGELEGIANFNIATQYYFNGKGYSEAFWVENPSQWMMLTSESKLSSELGQHYGALSLGASDIFGLPLSTNVLSLYNAIDGSMLVNPSVTLTQGDSISLKLEATSMFGDTGSEYAKLGDFTQYKLTATLGGLDF